MRKSAIHTFAGDDLSFREFCLVTRAAIADGTIEVYNKDSGEAVELSDLDLAVQYAIGKEQKERGAPKMELTVDDIYYLIGKHCGIKERARLLPDEDDD